MMLHLLLKILLLPPDLLKSHAQGYADLAGEVGVRYFCAFKNRWLMYGLSALTMLLALILGGVALLLWSALPLINTSRAWILVALPSFFLLVSGLSWWWARAQQPQPLLSDIQAQIQLDLQAIRQVHTA